jgi:hypothetical protein
MSLQRLHEVRRGDAAHRSRPGAAEREEDPG